MSEAGEGPFFIFAGDYGDEINQQLRGAEFFRHDRDDYILAKTDARIFVEGVDRELFDWAQVCDGKMRIIYEIWVKSREPWKVEERERLARMGARDTE